MIDADYVIVGAGTAGCVLAHRLSEDPAVQVVLLEAGGRDVHPLLHMPVGFMRALQQPALTWGLQSEPEPELDGRVLPIPRGRVLGGSSSINGMFHIRGHRRDFDEWSERGCRGWSYDEVLPYFCRSETNWRGASAWHGDCGPVQVRPIDTRHLLEQPLREAALRAGHAWTDDYDGAIQEGFARGDVAIDVRGRRSSSASAYLRPVAKRRNLRVLTRAHATRVRIERGHAIGVELQHRGRSTLARARLEVIVCAGAYHSPHLLMLSGIGPADALRPLGIDIHADLPGVGANLIEHPRLPLQYRARDPETFLNELRFDRAVLSALRWAFTGRGPFANQICSGTVLLRTNLARDRPDFQLLCNPVRLDAALWLPPLRACPEHSFYVTVCQLHALSRGRVSLRSADPGAPPRIQLNILSHPQDRAGMRAGLRAARAIYRESPMAERVIGELLPGAHIQNDAEIDTAMRALGGITHHAVGTCAMGIGTDAVVDERLRVRGIVGLRVADASVMPTIPGANTNAATLMIGEKAADLLREDIGGSVRDASQSSLRPESARIP